MNLTVIKKQVNESTRKYKLVFGLGMTGFSCVRYLVGQGCDIIVFDTRLNPPYLAKLKSDFPQIDVHVGKIDPEIFQLINQVIVSPGISLQTPELQLLQKMDVSLVGDVQLFVDMAKAPIIAITGSNGKSTTISLVAQLFEKSGRTVQVGGNIGIPVLGLLSEVVPDYYLLELSSFQLDTTPDLPAEISVVLNISEDHMDRYDGLDHYGHSKLSIYNQAKHKLLNIDDAWLRTHVESDQNTICYSSSQPKAGEYGLKNIDGTDWIMFGDEAIFNSSKMKMQGRHQLMNGVVALAIGDLCQLPREKMLPVLEQFSGLAHRTQFVAEVDGVTYINDSKGTNVGATIAAIKGINQTIVLIAGGESKGADFSELKNAIDGKVKQAILIGRDAGLIEKMLESQIPVMRAVNLPAAVKQASEIANFGECVLLSPACASFDMFENYQQRGEVFISAVKDL